MNYKLPNYDLLMEEYNNTLSSIKEIWVPLKYPMVKKGYRISNHGRIKSLNGKIKKVDHRNNDQEYVSLRSTNKKSLFLNISKLVAANFIDIPKELLDAGETILTLFIRHKNKINCCNASFNLEWITQDQYIKFMEKVYQHNHNVLTAEQVEEICKYLKGDLRISEIKHILNLNIADDTISSINTNRNWTNITEKYKLEKRGVKYSDECIHTLCKDLQNGMTLFDASVKYGMTTSYINLIYKKKHRINIASQYDFENKKVTPRKRHSLTDEMIHNICKDLESGLYTIPDIAKKYNIMYNVVYSIKTHKTYTEISNMYDIDMCISGHVSIPKDVIENVCRDIKKGIHPSIISSTHKVSQSLVYMIIHGKVHKEIFNNCEV